MNDFPDPQPGEFWSTSKGRTVEILARDVVYQPDTIAYRFLGASMIHLRSVASLKLWTKVEFE